jgi:hypothetical protein
MPTLAELTDAYLAGPPALRQAVAGMTREQLTARPVFGKWSALEVVAHLADFEAILADRIRRTLAFPKPLIFGADPDALAAAGAYNDRDMEEELRVVESIRASVGRTLRGLDEAVLGRELVHAERGLLTLEQLLGMATRHIPHHLPFIAEKRAALGV